MIYFAQLPTGAIKIGCSGDVDRRLCQLENYYRKPISLLHVMEGDRQTEREIHDRFAHLRLGGRRGNTEQFQPGRDLMEFIGKPLLVSQNPDAVEAVEPRGDMKLSVVKIETTLARKAKTIAEDKGIPLSTYLSTAIHAAIERDWPRVLRKMAGEAEGGAK